MGPRLNAAAMLSGVRPSADAASRSGSYPIRRREPGKGDKGVMVPQAERPQRPDLWRPEPLPDRMLRNRRPNEIH
jgi:hypothetical protein